MLKKLINEGAIDRGLRIVIGLVGLSLVFIGPKSAWGYIGFLPLITGLVGYCPMYQPFRFSTRGSPHRMPKQA